MTLKGRYWTLFWLLLFLGVAFVVVGRQNTSLTTAARLARLRDDRLALESRRAALEARIRQAESIEILGPRAERDLGLVLDGRNYELLRVPGPPDGGR